MSIERAIRRMANAAIVAALVILPVWSQAQTYKAPRTADGHPDLNGIWQALDTSANWNIESHEAQAGPLWQLGAAGAVPPGLGIVEGGKIPYLPAAAKQKEKNFENRLTSDPEIKCYVPGVPRATYMPFPFQIFQSSDYVMVVYEFANAVRTINLHDPGPSPTDSWMGWSAGHWEGDTLVVDVTGFVEDTWLDRSGNFHSDALHVIERYTPKSPDVLMYEATIEDPKVYSRPWKISLPLYRHVEKNAQLLEFKCVPFAEEMLYGHLRKHPIPERANKLTEEQK
jgi:hypothetical protein